eukprot:gene26161-11888_t
MRAARRIAIPGLVASLWPIGLPPEWRHSRSGYQEGLLTNDGNRLLPQDTAQVDVNSPEAAMGTDNDPTSEVMLEARNPASPLHRIERARELQVTRKALSDAVLKEPEAMQELQVTRKALNGAVAKMEVLKEQEAVAEAEQELQVTRKALNNAVAKMEVLKEQVAVADALQEQLAEQDSIIAKLKGLVEVDTQASAELVYLQGKLREAEVQMSEQQHKENADVAAMRKKLSLQEAEVEALKQELLETDLAKCNAETEAKAAENAAKVALEELSQRQAKYKALEEEVEKMKKPNAANQPFRGFGARIRSFGKGVDSSTRAAISQAQGAQLQKAEESIKQMKQQVAEKEKEVVAVKTDDGGKATLAAKLKEVIQARELAIRSEANLRAQVESLARDKETAVVECGHLRELLVQVERRNSNQTQTLVSLERDLKALHGEVSNISKLQDDILGMGKVLEGKEAELDTIRIAVRTALERESEMHSELVGAHEGMIRLQGMLGGMNTTNHDLVNSIDALDMEQRQAEREMRQAEGKAEEADKLLAMLGKMKLTNHDLMNSLEVLDLEQGQAERELRQTEGTAEEADKLLAELTAQVAELKTELGATETALVGAGDRLRVASSKESSQLERIEALVKEVQEQKAVLKRKEDTVGAEVGSARDINAAQGAVLEKLSTELEAQREAIAALMPSPSTIK